MVAKSHTAPSRNLLLSSHPLKEQPAQLSYCCSWSPLANYKLQIAWLEQGQSQGGGEILASMDPPQGPPGAVAHYHLLPRPSGKAAGGAHTPARWKYLWKQHGEGCIITSPRCASVPTDLILGMKLKRARCQRRSGILGEGAIHSEQCCSLPEQCVPVTHCDMSPCHPASASAGAALTSSPRHRKQWVGFVLVERACQALGSAVWRGGCSEEVWMSRAFARCQHRNNLILRWERQKMTSSFHCNLAAPKGFNMILQAELCCRNLSGGLRGTEHSFIGGGGNPRSKWGLEALYYFSYQIFLLKGRLQT